MSSSYHEQKYVKPEHELDAFNCPHCGAYAHQKWSEAYSTIDLGGGKYKDLYLVPSLTISVCEKCKEKYSVWEKRKLCYPLFFNAPFPEETLEDEIKEIFLEARAVFEQSPRSACSLLRYAIKKQIEKLNHKSTNLNKDIQNLIEKDLPEEIGTAISKAFKHDNKYYDDYFFILEDNEKEALKLFNLLNIIVCLMDTKKKKVESICKEFGIYQKETQ